MQAYGLELDIGSYITNATIESGDTFPIVNDNTRGRLFFREDQNVLYVRDTHVGGWAPLNFPYEEITQKSHVFVEENIGAPIYYNGTKWKFAIATDESSVSQAVLSGILDKNTILIVRAGIISYVNPSVIEGVAIGGASLIPGQHYYTSTTNTGKYSPVSPGKGEIKDFSLFAITKTMGLIVNSGTDLPIYLNDVVDVDITSPTNTQLLSYDSVTGTWKNSERIEGIKLLDELNDVDAPFPLVNQVLTFNSVEWVAKDLPTGVEKLDDLSDVDISSVTPVDGDVLSFVLVDGNWQPKPVNFKQTIIELNDTPNDYGTPGQFLVTNSTPDALEYHTLILSDCSDVATPTVTENGKVLTWDNFGSRWEYTKLGVDAGIYVEIAGSTMTGNLNMGSNQIIVASGGKIINDNIPVDPTDVPNKEYVDTEIADEIANQTLDDHIDVEIVTPPLDGQMLKYDALASPPVWVPTTPVTGPGPRTFLELYDTPQSYANGGWVLKISEFSNAIVFEPLELNDSLDVDITNISVDSILKWNGTNSWIISDVNSLVSKDLDDLADVNSASATDGQTIKWDGTEWVPVDVNSLVSKALNDLTDVDSASATDGQALVFNGTKWTPAPLNFIGLSDTPTEYAASSGDANKFLRVHSGGNKVVFDTASINDLSNVDAAAPTMGQLLTYDGTYWVPGSPTGTGATIFTELLDTPLDYVGAANKILKVSDLEDEVVFGELMLNDISDVNVIKTLPTDGQVLTYDANATPPVWVPGDTAFSEFISLSDTPAAYISGDENKFLKVNPGKDGIVFTDAKMTDLTDVDTVGASDRNVLVYDGNNNQWVADHFQGEFIKLDDTPLVYAGNGGKYLKVADTEDKVVFEDSDALVPIQLTQLETVDGKTVFDFPHEPGHLFVYVNGVLLVPPTVAIYPRNPEYVEDKDGFTLNEALTAVDIICAWGFKK